MKLIEYFNTFLDEEVNLNDSRLKLLDQRVQAITSFLRESATFKNNFLDIIPQGSYAHKTIIRPVQTNDEFDADLLLYVTEFNNWSARDYVEELYKAFRDSSIYRNMAGRNTRCVTVDYAGDFHIDIVPYLERHSLKYVTNRHKDLFELTDPEAYNTWLDEKNRTAGGYLVKVIRLVKYLRDFKQTFDIKSIILSILLGEQISDAALLLDSDYYKDVPTTLRNVMNHLREYVEARPSLPSIMDPAGTGESFSDRWNQQGYANFRSWVIYYAKKIEAAYSEADKDISLKLWQEVFGSEFQAPKSIAKALESTRISSASSVTFRNTEEQLADKGIALQLNPRYTVRISARVADRSGFRSYFLSNYGNKVTINRSVRFAITKCSVPQPYKIYWKVKNNGEEARRQDCIRGQIVEGGYECREPTAFRGSHYVECYIVKDGICVAKDRQEVTIL